MAYDNAPPVRPWQVVAAELAKETDNAKVLALVVELGRALAEWDKRDKPDK